MNAHLFQFLGDDAFRAAAYADLTGNVMTVLETIKDQGVTGRVRLADMGRPAIFQLDVRPCGKVSMQMNNLMLMVATNQEGADLIRKWIVELQNSQPSGPNDISQVIGDFFPPPSPPSNDTKP